MHIPQQYICCALSKFCTETLDKKGMELPSNFNCHSKTLNELDHWCLFSSHHLPLVPNKSWWIYSCDFHFSNWKLKHLRCLCVVFMYRVIQHDIIWIRKFHWHSVTLMMYAISYIFYHTNFIWEYNANGEFSIHWRYVTLILLRFHHLHTTKWNYRICITWVASHSLVALKHITDIWIHLLNAGLVAVHTLYGKLAWLPFNIWLKYLLSYVHHLHPFIIIIPC